MLTVRAEDPNGVRAQEILFLAIKDNLQAPITQSSCSRLQWSAEGTVCASAPKTAGKCQKVMFVEAKTQCEELGARLCSSQELSSSTIKDSGDCDVKQERVWTSSICGFDADVLTQAGQATGLQNVRKECTPQQSLAMVKCCASVSKNTKARPGKSRKAQKIS